MIHPCRSLPRPSAPGHPLPLLLSAALVAVTLICLACHSAPPPPEPPTFDVEALASDPDIAQLLGRRYEIVQARPHKSELWTGLGLAFEANDFHLQAVLCYEHAAKLAQQHPEDTATVASDAKNQYRLGVAHLALGQLREAEQAFGAAASLRPDFTAAHWQQGNARFDLAQLDAAEASFETALKQQGNVLPARLGLARIALERGHAEGAEKRLLNILEDVPSLTYGRFLLADARRQLGREVADDLPLDTTAPQWPDPWQQELEDLRVGYAADMRRAEEALQQGRADIALPLLEKLHRERPDDIAATTNLSAAYIGSSRGAEAIALLDAAYAEHPERFTVSMNLAAAHFAVGDLEQALAWAQRAEELDPEKLRALEMQGEIHTRRQDFDAARRTFEEVLERDPDNLQSLQRLAWLHEQAGRWGEAQETYARALRVAPHRGDLAYRLGGTLFRMGRPRFALQALDQAKRLGTPAALQGDLETLYRRTEEAVQRLDSMQPREELQSAAPPPKR